MIPSQQRATILSFDSLMTSAGGIVAQPALGKSADVWGYQVSYLLSAAGSALALPFIVRARRLNSAGRPSRRRRRLQTSDRLSQGDRSVIPTAPARGLSSHRGSPAGTERPSESGIASAGTRAWLR